MSIATAKDPSTNVRMPADLMDQIDAQAAKNGRSRNTEIVIRLRKSLEADRPRRRSA